MSTQVRACVREAGRAARKKTPTSRFRVPAGDVDASGVRSPVCDARYTIHDAQRRPHVDAGTTGDVSAEETATESNSMIKKRRRKPSFVGGVHASPPTHLVPEHCMYSCDPDTASVGRDQQRNTERERRNLHRCGPGPSEGVLCVQHSKHRKVERHTGTRAHGHTGTRAHGHTGTRAHGHTGTRAR